MVTRIGPRDSGAAAISNTASVTRKKILEPRIVPSLLRLEACFRRRVTEICFLSFTIHHTGAAQASESGRPGRSRRASRPATEASARDARPLRAGRPLSVTDCRLCATCALCAALAADGDWNKVRQPHISRLGAVLHRVVPRWIVSRAGVLHQVASEIDGIRLRHPDTAVRCRVADRLLIVRAVNVVVGLLKKDLHRAHRVLGIAGRGWLFSLRP